MKSIKKFAVWIMLSLALQFSVYLYLDKFFFVNETSFKTKKIEDKVSPIKKVENIKIPENAKSLTISYDGKYASYYEDGNLKVINTQTAVIKAIPIEQGLNISFCKWLPDRDRMIIAEKKDDNGTFTIKFSTYDVNNNEKTEIRDTHDKLAFVTLRDSKAEVQNIDLSTLNNVIYIKVGRKGNTSSIYRINVMGEMEKVTTGLIGNIKMMTRDDRLLYEDISDSQINVEGLDKTVRIKGVNKLALLSSDKDDNIFVGQMQDDKVIKIFSGSLTESTDTWKVNELKIPVETKDIFITTEGKIYVNDNLRGVVTDTTSNQETSYKGEFLEMNTTIISSVQNNMLFETGVK